MAPYFTCDPWRARPPTTHYTLRRPRVAISLEGRGKSLRRRTALLVRAAADAFEQALQAGEDASAAIEEMAAAIRASRSGPPSPRFIHHGQPRRR